MQPHTIASSSLTRRGFVVTSLAAGFAFAVRPVSAATVTTDDTELEAGAVEIPVQGGKIPGYRAMPKAGRGRPVVLVVQEIFGVHEHIRDVCRRLAKEGYLAVAPELYARQGEKMKAALTAAGSPSRIVVFDGVEHGFHADYRPSYDETAAKDGWKRLLAWFREHGGA